MSDSNSSSDSTGLVLQLQLPLPLGTTASSQDVPPSHTAAAVDAEPRRDFLAIRAQSSGTYRVERLGGNDYIVVPVVALVEGVLQGVVAQQPELALASEFGRFPASWNGRPITINHPHVKVAAVEAGIERIEIVYISANTSPEVLESFQVGFIFNTKVDGAKLLMEAWIDPVKVNEHSDAAKQLLAKIKRGEKIEVSTGLFNQAELSQGSYNTQQYYSVWRHVVPDHLALLPGDLVGACSNADGCGINIHAQVQQLATSCGCGGGVAATSSSGSDGRLSPVTPTTTTPPSDMTPSAALAAFSFAFNAQDFLANLMPAGMMDSDVRSLIQKELDDAYPGAYPYLVGFTNKSAVFSVYDSIDGDRCTYQCSYSIDATSKVCVLADDCVEVVLTTAITPVSDSDSEPPATVSSLNSQENPMTTVNTTQPGAPAAVTTPTPTTPAASAAAATTTTTTPATEQVPAPVQAPSAQPTTPVNANAQPATSQPPQTVEQYLAAAPPGVREALQAGMRMHSQRKATLIQQLTALSGRCKFTAEQLQAMEVPMLENLVELAVVPSYAGQAPAGNALHVHSQQPTVNEGDSGYAAAPPRLKPAALASAQTQATTP